MKKYGETYFEVNRNLWAKCWSEKTRYGFRHLSELIYKFEVLETEKTCYYNRTWESYTYESVLRGLYNKAKENQSLKPHHLRLFKKMIANGGKAEAKRVKKEFNTIAMVASLGSIFGKDQKEANDWKARMIKAGLANKGLTMPEDWDELSEADKESRLNKVIEHLGK